MNLNWPLVKLGEYCIKIGSGATPKGGDKVYLNEGIFALIRSQNIYNDGFKKKGLVYIDEHASEKLKNVEVKKNDVLINITGDSVARICSVPPEILPARVNQHVAIIRPDPKEFDSRFIRYFFSTAQNQDFLLMLSSAGATRNALTKEMIQNLQVPKPTLKEQTAIADILSTFDNKIELNNQTNQTLEQIAQTIFKSWFIDFDPVHAKAKGQKPVGIDAETAALFPDSFEESELGLTPKGWETRTLNEICQLRYGKALKGNIRKKGAVHVYGSGGIIGFHDKHLIDGPAIIIGRKGTVGSLFWEENDCYPIDTTFYVQPNDTNTLYWIYRTLEQIDLKSLGSDSAVPGVNRSSILAQKVPLPPAQFISHYNLFIKGLRKKQQWLQEQNFILITLRDSLLPKLISCELHSH